MRLILGFCFKCLVCSFSTSINRSLRWVSWHMLSYEAQWLLISNGLACSLRVAKPGKFLTKVMSESLLQLMSRSLSETQAGGALLSNCTLLIWLFDRLRERSCVKPNKLLRWPSKKEIESKKFSLRFKSSSDLPTNCRPTICPSYLPMWLQDKFKVRNWLSCGF